MARLREKIPEKESEVKIRDKVEKDWKYFKGIIVKVIVERAIKI